MKRNVRRYEADMPKELEEVYVVASSAAIEKAVRERGDEIDRMRKIELIREGVSSGKQRARGCPCLWDSLWKKVRRCLSGPQVVCQVGVGIEATAHVDLEVFSILSEDMDGS